MTVTQQKNKGTLTIAQMVWRLIAYKPWLSISFFGYMAGCSHYGNRPQTYPEGIF
jgi:hypothetical protein